MWAELILAPLLAGFSTGLFCCLTCYPLLAPLMAAEARSTRANGLVWLYFLTGRLTGYLTVGALIGWLGEEWSGGWLHTASNVALILMALILLVYAVGFLRPRWSFCAAGTRRAALAPLLLGALTGLHACPPVLLSVAYVFTLQSWGKGLVYFFLFFCATSLYLVPLLGLGWLGRIREFRLAARLSALLVGALFLGYGILRL